MLQPDSHADQTDQRFCRAKMLLAELLQLPSIIKELEDERAIVASQVYTQAPKLWLLVLWVYQTCVDTNAPRESEFRKRVAIS